MTLFDTYKERNSSVEILRMLFMAGIVFLHAYYHGSNADIEWIYGLGTSTDSSYQLILYSLSRLGVTGFMFISGYYGIRMNAVRLYRLLSMVCIYWLVTTVICGNISIGGLVKGVIHAWDMWWFVASYFMICILSPLINEGIERISKKTFSYVLLGIVVYTYIGHFIIGKDSHDTDILLSIYLIARYIRLYITPPLFKESTLVYMYNFYHYINDFTINCYENYRKRKDYRHAYMQQLANRVNFSRNYGNVDGQVSIAYRYS